MHVMRRLDATVPAAVESSSTVDEVTFGLHKIYNLLIRWQGMNDDLWTPR